MANAVKKIETLDLGVKLITDPSKLDKAIKTWGKQVESLPKQLKILSLSAAEHFRTHGDTIFLNRLYTVMPAAMQKNYVNWCQSFCGVKLETVQDYQRDDNDKVVKDSNGKPIVTGTHETFLKEKGAKIDLLAAKNAAVDTFRPDRPYNYTPFDFVDIIKRAVENAQTHLKEDFQKGQMDKMAKASSVKEAYDPSKDRIPESLLAKVAEAWKDWNESENAKANSELIKKDSNVGKDVKSQLEAAHNRAVKESDNGNESESEEQSAA